MIRVLVSSSVVLAGMLLSPWLNDVQTAVGQQRRFTPPIVSPEVSEDRKVTFRIRAPEAETVRVNCGDMPEVGGAKEMVKNDEGVFELTVGPVDPGAYRYRLDVNGLQVCDPSNPTMSESNAHSWSLVYVPGSEWMDNRSIPHGAVAEVNYYSESLKRPRRMHVYTPPGYEKETEKTYPVFYLLHGASDCDDSWSTVGRAGFILDNLIESGAAKSMVVVMPAGHTGPFTFGRSGLPINEFVEDFNKDIKPYVEENYRVSKERKDTAIAGLSMGGAHTLSIAVPQLDEFAYVGVYSSGIFGSIRDYRG